MKANLTSGISATEFGAHDQISREQLAVFLIRALGAEELAKANNFVSVFSDAAQVDDYAKPYVALAQKNGLISGSENGDGTFRFEPLANAERQAVAILAYKLYANRDALTTVTPLPLNQDTNGLIHVNATTTDNVLAPYLSLSSDEKLYTLAGTISGKEFGTLFPDKNMDWSKIKNVQFTIIIDKATNLKQSMSMQMEVVSGEKNSTQFTYQNYNKVNPIELPKDATASEQPAAL